MAVLSDDMGGITAYAAAVNRGYTGTKEEFEQLMYSYTEVAERAEAAAGNAHESEEASIEAKDIAVNAKNEAVSARDAAVSARDASISAKNNSESARDAAISAKNDTLAAKDAVMSAKSSVDETSANFSDEVTAAISDVNAAGRNQKELAKTHAVDSEAWAVGQREGADVGVSDTTYHNNSKYYAEQSALAKDGSVSAKNAAESAKADAISAKNQAETAKGDAQDIVADINDKSEQIDQNAEDISDLQTAISTKAEIDGNYENLTAGTAEQLASTVFIEDNAPYHFRTSGGSADIGDREYDQIVGGTINWNQLVQNGNFSNGSNRWSLYMATVTSDNNTATVVTADTVDVNSGGSLVQAGITVFANHKYIVSATIKGDGEHRTALRADGGFIFDTIFNISNDFKTFAGVAVGNSVNSSGRVVVTAYGPSMTILVKNVILFDLTAMFGPTIADYIYSLEQAHAGDGVAWFRKYFPKDYYEYNSGELISVSGLSAHKMTGFNQWDEEWEVGTINSGNGQNVAASDRIRSKNYTHIINSMSYYVCLPDSVFNGSQLYVALYDADKNFVRASLFNTANGFSGRILFSYFLRGASYLRFWFGGEYGTTYKGDVCLNLHWDGERDGEYEPYEEHSYPLDSDVTLRGIPKLDANNQLYADGDIYDADGTVTRKYGTVDLGELGFVYESSVANKHFLVPPNFFPKKPKYHGELLSTIYVGTKKGYQNISNMEMCIDNSEDTPVFRIRNDAYTSASDFKAAMSGVMLVYELAEPATEQAQSFTNPQIVDDFGTEEYVTNSIVPVGHITKYANNLRAKLEMAPNSPDGDGDYIVRQTNGLNEYVSLSSSEVIQNINEAISDNAEQIEVNTEDVSQLKSDFSATTVDGYNLIKIAEHGVGAYYASGSTLTFNASYTGYHYAIMPVEPNSRYYVSQVPRWWVLTDDDNNVLSSGASFNPGTKRYIDTGNATKFYYTISNGEWNNETTYGARYALIVSKSNTGSGSRDNVSKPEWLNGLSQRMFDSKYAFAFNRVRLKFTKNANKKFYFKNLLALDSNYAQIYADALNVEGTTKDYISITFTSTGEKAMVGYVFDANLSLVEQQSDIKANVANDNLSDCSVLVIGDSTVEQNVMTQKMLDAFTARDKTLTLLGTRGTAPNLHEGRSGWSAKQYCTQAANNPFYNNGFDFANYMTTQGYNAVDYVILQVGINDLYNVSLINDNEKIIETMGYVCSMIDSILAWNTSQKIIVNLLTPINPNYTGDYMYAKRNIFVRYNAQMLLEITKYNIANVRPSDTFAILDPESDISDNVHPNATGYEKMALEVVNQINCWQNGI